MILELKILHLYPNKFIMDYSFVCLELEALCRKTGAYLREESRHLLRSGIEIKGENDYVTYVDKESERRLVEGLRNILPQAGFLTEEGTAVLNGEVYCWVVDPLDGTTNFIHQLPPYSISVGLMWQHEIVLGCVYEVTLDEAFYAWKGGKAWMNGQEIRVSSTPQVKNSLIAHGIPYHVEPKYEYLRKSISKFYGLSTSRLLGSAAAEICYVAAGRMDAYFHDNLSPWDVAGGAIILQEAGGQISDFSTGDNYIFGRELLASNGRIHEELLDMLISSR